MQRWLPFLVPFAAIVGAGAVLAWLGRSAPACEGYRSVDLSDVVLEDGCIQLRGQAHYSVVVRQTVPGNLLREEQTHFLFPLFPEHDTTDRAVRVLVRTTREPESLVSYETMQVSGRLQPVTSDEVPPGTEVDIGKRSDYFFTDSMVLLVPDRIVSDGETWERPGL